MKIKRSQARHLQQRRAAEGHARMLVHYMRVTPGMVHAFGLAKVETGIEIVGNGLSIMLFYWREGNDEVDLIVRTPAHITTMEIKSGRFRGVKGLPKCREMIPGAKPFIIGTSGVSLKEFLYKDRTNYWEI